VIGLFVSTNVSLLTSCKFVLACHSCLAGLYIWFDWFSGFYVFALYNWSCSLLALSVLVFVLWLLLIVLVSVYLTSYALQQCCWVLALDELASAW